VRDVSIIAGVNGDTDCFRLIGMGAGDAGSTGVNKGKGSADGTSAAWSNCERPSNTLSKTAVDASVVTDWKKSQCKSR
jgi:hypothetical protein